MLNLTEEQSMLQDTARKFIKEKIAPLVNQYEAKGQLCKEDAHHFLKMLQPLGYIGPMVAEEFGGPGLDHISKSVLMFELAKVWPSLAGVAGITSGICLGLSKSTNKELRERYLPGLMSADRIGCMCITEPNVGSDPSNISTTAVLDGDHYVLNGTKMWISNGSIADYAVVVCIDKAAAQAGRGGLFELFVDRSESPFSSREIHKIGLRAFPTSEVVFEDCRVPKENILFPTGVGFEATQKGLIGARIATGVQSCAIAEAALEAAVRYSKERVQWGRPLAKFQGIQFMIAEMKIKLEAAKLLTWNALKQLDEGKPCRLESSICKAYACEVGWRICSTAMEIFGAYGLAEEYNVERYFRDARVFPIPDGTTEINKLVVAREVLGISALR